MRLAVHLMGPPAKYFLMQLLRRGWTDVAVVVDGPKRPLLKSNTRDDRAAKTAQAQRELVAARADNDAHRVLNALRRVVSSNAVFNAALIDVLSRDGELQPAIMSGHVTLHSAMGEADPIVGSGPGLAISADSDAALQQVCANITGAGVPPALYINLRSMHFTARDDDPVVRVLRPSALYCNGVSACHFVADIPADGVAVPVPLAVQRSVVRHRGAVWDPVDACVFGVVAAASALAYLRHQALLCHRFCVGVLPRWFDAAVHFSAVFDQTAGCVGLAGSDVGPRSIGNGLGNIKTVANSAMRRIVDLLSRDSDGEQATALRSPSPGWAVLDILMCEAFKYPGGRVRAVGSCGPLQGSCNSQRRVCTQQVFGRRS